VDKKLKQCIEGENGNYLLPFFWVHGEDEEKLRTEIGKIYDMGIHAICVESRPHPEFVGEKWWADMDVIIDEAKKRNMKVWILDDMRFPTGFAAGSVEKAPPELKKWYLFRKIIDVYGPDKDTSFLISSILREKEYLIGVVAAKRVNEDSEDVDSSLIDLTDRIVDGVLYWDIPEGHWRIFVLYETYDAKGVNNLHVNHLVRESVKLLIDNVYQKHYDRYAEEFGKTIAGFFSDEPAFYNFPGTYEASIGRKQMLLPWRRGLLEEMEMDYGKKLLAFLPGLWFDIGEMTPYIRYVYMEKVSKLYAENFAGQIGDWCRKHNVEYIGHIIEDNNAHARLGNGPGHFFRALWGQDMSGLDVVLLQLLPGMTGHNMNLTGFGDGEFFHFGLAKMAASLGHMDPKKKGRTVCEIYGAYGWMEGLKLMKWLTDHMLVRGVNHFVPHAFTNREFPDPDCPPHFNFDKVNPQYRYMHILMKYTNRLCHLFNDGMHIANGLVLYHAEAEWSGDYMLFQKPLRKLMENQIDCDVLPSDLFKDMVFENNKMILNNERYDFLVVPWSKGLPALTLNGIILAAENGVKVFFIDSYPELVSDDVNNTVLIQKIKQNMNCSVTSLDELPKIIRMMGYFDINCMTYEPYLRAYHYKRGNSHIYMFFNEHPRDSIVTEIEFKDLPAKFAYEYDAFENRLKLYKEFKHGNSEKMKLQLSCYESKVFIFDNDMSGECTDGCPDGMRIDTCMCAEDELFYASNFNKQEIPEDYEISISRAADYDKFQYKFRLKKLRNISAPDLMPDFSGTIRYSTSFNFNLGAQNSDVNERKVILDMGECYETAEVWVNGINCGVKICPPYRFDIGKAVKKGVNTLTIDVTNTLVKEHRDFFSALAKQEPSGLLGPVNLYYNLYY